MNMLSRSDRISVIHPLVEGVSVNSIVRMTGISKVTILKLLLDMGRACLNFEDARLRGLFCAHVEADEIWSFVHCKDKNVSKVKRPVEQMGDCWTWYAVDRDSKAIISWIMGDRDVHHAKALMRDLAWRLECRPEISTDALKHYNDAVFDAFSGNVDYAQVSKVVRTVTNPQGEETESVETVKRPIFGSPHLERTGTSRVERANLTLRMTQRRWTRRTNGHSKSFMHMQAAFALHTCHYNWVRHHMTIGTTPAKALGVADREWSMEDLIGLLEEQEQN